MPPRTSRKSRLQRKKMKGFLKNEIIKKGEKRKIKNPLPRAYFYYLKGRMSKKQLLFRLKPLSKAWLNKLAKNKEKTSFLKNHYFMIKKLVLDLEKCIKKKKIPDLKTVKLASDIFKKGVKISKKDIIIEIYKIRAKEFRQTLEDLEYEIKLDNLTDNGKMYNYLVKENLRILENAINKERFLTDEERDTYAKFFKYEEMIKKGEKPNK